MLGGCNIELTGEDVTNASGSARTCRGRSGRAYRSQVGPRLNAEQALELGASLIARRAAQQADAKDSRAHSGSGPVAIDLHVYSDIYLYSQ